MATDVVMDDMDIDFTMDEDPEIARLNAEAARINAVCNPYPSKTRITSNVGSTVRRGRRDEWRGGGEGRGRVR